MNMMNKLITIAIAAEILGLSRIRISQLVATSRIKAEKVGGIWLIDPDDLERFRQLDRPRGWPKGIGRDGGRHGKARKEIQ